jgi:membrane protease YdiL (CAAX protease family)
MTAKGVTAGPSPRDHPVTWPRRYPVTIFVTLALVITWVVWVPRALATALEWSGPVADSFTSLGAVWSYGPAAAAVAAALLTGGRPALRELGARLTRWRVHPGWYAVVLGGPPAVWLTAAAAHLALGGDAADAVPLAVDAGLAGAVPLLLLLCLTDGLGEETGWRGYALPRLLKQTGPLRASLVLGLIWAVWHLPLYWTETAALYQTSILLLLIDLPVTAVLYTWVFQRTGGSALHAVLLHGTGNLFALPLPSNDDGSLSPFLLTMAVRVLLAIAVVLALRQDTVPLQDS